jgi:hypothetical protein
MLLLVVVVFTLLGMILDLKIITIYDVNPFVSFTLIFLCVGALVGGVFGIRTVRRLTKGDEDTDQRRD